MLSLEKINGLFPFFCHPIKWVLYTHLIVFKSYLSLVRYTSAVHQELGLDWVVNL